jgi:uncharacterized protein YbbC (DUF1343 family)
VLVRAKASPAGAGRAVRSLALGLTLACALGAAFGRAPAGAAPIPPAAVTLGDEVFLQESWRELHGRCVGIVTNQTGVTSQLESLVDAVRRNPQICVKAIYSPEHGPRGDQPAGAYVPSYLDARSGLPVYSLYGKTRRPTAEMLDGVDVVLFDIQDVGDRAYTYISTMAYVMEAAKAFHKEVWILDRPNPLGGEIVEGPVLDPRFASFVGLYPIALRHGMTVGELARLFNERFGIGAELRVIKLRGWRREMLWPATGLAWVQTSPNIPEWDTTLVYPTTGLIDEAGINNGVGFTKPFKYAGAFGLDGARLAEYLNARPIPGVFFRAASWTPLSGFWSGKQLGGVELIVTNPRTYRAVRTSVEILCAVRAVAPGLLAVHADALDKNWGTDALRLGLTGGLPPEQIVRSWQPETEAFRLLRARFLLYP